MIAKKANAHEYIEQGEPLIEIINLSKIELKLILPSTWLEWVKPGLTFNTVIKETNKRYQAQINRLNHKIDHISNTFTAFATFKHFNKDVKPGMSGMAIFKKEDK